MFVSSQCFALTVLSILTIRHVNSLTQLGILDRSRNTLCSVGVGTFYDQSFNRNAAVPNTASFNGNTAVPNAASYNVIAIEYDAAAKFEYGLWCEKYEKGEFDAVKYEIFKANYEMVSIANVKAARERREGRRARADMGLNEYADMTKEEYMIAKNITVKTLKVPTKTEEVETIFSEEESGINATDDYLNEYIDVEEFENMRYKSLQEAKNALAGEQSIFVKKLGLRSVEELEVVLATMDRMSNSSIDIDTIFVRKTKIRTAYLDWCKQFSKQVDETRFLTFSDNYEKFEAYFKKKNIPIKLNYYADYTEDEYKTHMEQEAERSAFFKAEVDNTPNTNFENNAFIKFAERKEPVNVFLQAKFQTFNNNKESPARIKKTSKAGFFSSLFESVTEKATMQQPVAPTTPPVNIQPDGNIEVINPVQDAFNLLFGGGSKPNIKEQAKSAFSFSSSPDRKNDSKNKFNFNPGPKISSIPSSATFSISETSGGMTLKPDIPILSAFKQNEDGSISGIVSYSSIYRDGIRITTSPVPMGARPGMIVTTSNGTKYQLD